MTKQYELSKIKNALTGSQADMAKRSNTDLAATWVNIDVVTLCDISGSMAIQDSSEGRSRYEELKRQLKTILAEYEGRVAVYEFSMACNWCPDGKLSSTASITDMTSALNKLYNDGIDNLGVKIVVLSDGEPDNPQTALSIARRFKTKIDAIYIGPETEYEAIKFMKDLAAVSGGTYAENIRLAQQQLSDQVGRLLLSDGSTQSGPIHL